MRSAQSEPEIVSADAFISEGIATVIDSPIIAVLDADELAFELAVWIAGLKSFLRTGGGAFAEKTSEPDSVRDRRREFRLTRAGLLTCSKLNFRLRSTLNPGRSAHDLTPADLDEVILVLRDAVILNENLLASSTATFAEWKVWSETLEAKFDSSPELNKLIGRMEASGEKFLPHRLRTLLADNSLSFEAASDLRMILPRFGLVLGALAIVGRMLERDEPLKPSLLIFSWVYEATSDLVSHMNSVLTRFPQTEAEVFDSLDSASYTSSLELKKVYSQELSGLASIRPVPSVFARIETAYELLSDSFRQMLAGFARLGDPAIRLSDLFPTYNVKLERSLALRQQLWHLLQAVRSAEKDTEDAMLEPLKITLRDFLETTAVDLFHKDTETLERFAEEILATPGHDIGTILHRFGAYVETLLGQVNMRTVIADHPFDPAERF